LQRNLDADDIMQTNAFIDLILVRKALTGQDLELGCASLSSWGISTQQDSLLAGSSVITRWLDWTLYDALVDNPLLIVHHPSESDEQPWLSLAVPGWLGVLSGLNENASWASLNMGNDHPMLNAEGLDPVCQDIRRGLERLDYNADGASNALDVYTALNEGNHLHGTIIHIISENDGQTITAAVETNNSGTAIRYYDQNGNLPGNHLAATNHFRVLTYPTCCDRYTNITDSLTTNHHMTAKRQWQVLSGAAGQQNNLSAIQYTPSTGALLWSGATTSLPAYQAPALSLNAQTLFSYNVANPQETLTPASPDLRCHPNPLSASEILKVSSSEPFQNLSLYNLRGQQLFTSASSQPARQLEIELPPLPAGVYLLRATHPQGRQSVRKILLWH